MKLVGHFLCRSGRGTRSRFGSNIFASLVLDRRIGELALDGVGGFDVTNRSRRRLDLSSNAFVALRSQACGPAHGLTYAYLVLPLRAHGPQVVSKDRGRAAAIRAMNYRDVPVGKLYAFVHRGNAAIVPLFDLTQKDVHHDIRIEMDGLVDSGK